MCGFYIIENKRPYLSREDVDEIWTRCGRDVDVDGINYLRVDRTGYGLVTDELALDTMG